VSEPFTNNERETSCSQTSEIAEVSKNTVGSRRRERLIREEITGDYEEYEWQVDDEECDGVDGIAEREVLESKRGISALNWKDTGKCLWRPDYRPRLNEWVADFALAGRAALEPARWASHMVLFRTYYLGLAPYDTARHFVGLSERSWLNWTEEIRQRCGEELLSVGCSSQEVF
jgi:hypothetical protein